MKRLLSAIVLMLALSAIALNTYPPMHYDGEMLSPGVTCTAGHTG